MILPLLTVGGPQQAAEALVAAANDAGGRDNITAMVVDILGDIRSADETPTLTDQPAISPGRPGEPAGWGGPAGPAARRTCRVGRAWRSRGTGRTGRVGRTSRAGLARRAGRPVRRIGGTSRIRRWPGAPGGSRGQSAGQQGPPEDVGLLGLGLIGPDADRFDRGDR